MINDSNQLNYENTIREKNRFLARTYAWMSGALLISALSAFLAANSLPIMNFLWGVSNNGRPVGFIVLAILELVLVWTLSANIRKMKLGSVITMFIVYSIINGLTLSSIFWVFSLSSITYCFIASAVMFAGMSIYGMKTKTSLNKAGKYLMMALIGLVAVSLINLLISFITKTPLAIFDWILSFATVIIFTGLTAYDSQRILRASEHSDGNEDYKKLAIYGALELYLDFINIFLSLLRLFGRKN